MTDLPKRPCYDSTYCDYVYNCGGTTYPFSCDPDTNPSTNAPIANVPPDKCPSGMQEGYCFGSDPYYCSGIYQTCDPKLGIKCQIGINNPAVNYYGEHIGCNVETDSPCLEFESYQPCQDTCWNLGGSNEVENVCASLFTDQLSCNSMKYFCKWNSSTHKCGTLINTDPWTIFKKNGPKDPTGNPSALSTETVNGKWTLNCAQSSWSSTDIDSYAESVRTCCLDKNDGSNKVCVTTPRCQFVKSTCECGFKDISFYGNPNYQSSPTSPKHPLFICDETQTTVTTSSGTKVEKGYCTWCKGSMLKDFDYRMWLINNGRIAPGMDIRDSIAWGTEASCNNRCTDYNFCEKTDSESLWNKCIWDKSSGVYGIDPTTATDFSKGFCYAWNNVNDCITAASGNMYKINLCNDMEKYKNLCETELQTTISTKNELAAIKVNTNGGTAEALACSEGSTWKHTCSKSLNNSGGGSYAENYVCGWCPNLQNEANTDSCSTDGPTVAPTSSPVSNSGNMWYSILSSDYQTAIQILTGIIFGIVIFLIAIILIGLKITGKI